MAKMQVLELGLGMGERFCFYFSSFLFMSLTKLELLKANLEHKWVLAKFGQIYDISYINLVTTWFFCFFVLNLIHQLGPLVMIPNIN
jgi:hypothetical protein